MDASHLKAFEGREVTVVLKYKGKLEAINPRYNDRWRLRLSGTMGSFTPNVYTDYVVSITSEDPPEWPPLPGDVWADLKTGDLFLSAMYGRDSWTLGPASPTRSRIYAHEFKTGARRAGDWRLMTPGIGRITEKGDC